MNRFGPRVLGVALLWFLLLLPASSLGQVAVTSASGFSTTGLQIQTANLWSEPLWNQGQWWRGKQRKPPAHIPDGGSTAIYLSLTGLACLAAISMKKRLKSE